MGKYTERLDTFTEANVPTLDEVVLGALELFADSLPQNKLPDFKKPLVVGSVGAFAAGKMMFAGKPAIFANESSFEQELIKNPDIDGAILISASGGKHAITIGASLKEKGLSAVLVTNNPNAKAKEFFADDAVLVLPKNREPYTYNTSTYMGMVLSQTGESVSDITAFIKNEVDPVLRDDFANFDSFTFIVPSELHLITELITIKFEELLIPLVWGRAYAFEEIKHAKTVVSSEKEMFITIGSENQYFGTEDRRLHIPLPDGADYGTIMAISYYVVGAIQKAHPNYFQEGIAEYVANASKIFGYEIKSIVE